MVSDYTVDLLNQILEMKDSIARMNLSYLYKACIGMHQNKMKLLEKGTSGTQHLVEKYGWDTKQGMHAYRVLDFLERFLETGFEDFKQAIKYDVLLLFYQSNTVSIAWENSGRWQKRSWLL